MADGTPLELKQKNRWHGAVEVVFADETDDRRPLFSTLASCKQVERRGARYTLFPARPGTLLQDTTALLAAHNQSPLSIAVMEGRLDEVFRTLTDRTEPSPVQS